LNASYPFSWSGIISELIAIVLMLFLVLYLLLQVLDARSHEAAECTSWSNCPFTCPGNRSNLIESDTLAMLAWPFHFQDSAKAFLNNVASAITILRAFGSLISSDKYYLHTTMQYLCCYSTSDYEQKIVPALNAVKWTPFNVTYDRLVCNFDNATNGPTTTTVSLILLLSERSQTQLGALVKQFEQVASGLRN
jgi:hypothetical protein